MPKLRASKSQWDAAMDRVSLQRGAGGAAKFYPTRAQILEIDKRCILRDGDMREHDDAYTVIDGWTDEAGMVHKNVLPPEYYV